MEAYAGFLLQLLEAALLGGLLGWEREIAGKPAGLRTVLLICVGSCLFTQLSFAVPSEAGFGDPARIAAQIVSGIGFLGAGTIIQSRQAVHGLTSAAVIWASAAVGMTVGAGLQTQAALATVLVLVVLVTLRWLERRLLGQDMITLEIRYKGPLPGPEELLAAAGLKRRMIRSSRRRSPGDGGHIAMTWRGQAGDANLVAAVADRVPGLTVEGWELEVS